MKRFVLALALGLGAAAPAYAVSTSYGDANTPDALPTGFQSLSYYEDFNDMTATGLNNADIQTQTVLVPGGDPLYAQPANDPTPYYSVGPSTSSPQTLAISGFDRMSLYWGSLDSYNRITFLGLGAVFSGSAFQAGFGDGLVSRQVTFDFTPEEAKLITGVEFASLEGKNAFEFDNLAFGTAVPEPSVWAMMMLGLGLVGAALRRRASSLGGAFAA